MPRNIWPDAPVGLRGAVEVLELQLQQVADTVLRAMALELPETWFVRRRAGRRDDAL